MIRGFLAGAVSGAVLSGLVAGTASVLTDGPQRSPDPAPQQAPPTGSVAVTPGSGFEASRADPAARPPEAETRPESGPAPAPAPDKAGDPASGADTQPARTDAARTDGTAAPDAPRADTRPEAVDGPALRRNATPFTAPRDKPLMAVILTDTGDGTVAPDRLAGFPYPLNIALDPDRPGAADAAKRYRTAGFEVLLTLDLPPDATAAATRAALREGVERVPQAVAVLEGAATGLSASGAAPILAQTGHGLVTRAPARDTATATALARMGVSAAPLRLDLDAGAPDRAAIAAELDRAAGRAGAGQGMIVSGRLRPETLSALSTWAATGGARRVALAPVSAVLSGVGEPPDR